MASERYIASVVKILDPYTVVINKGTNVGIKNDQLFLLIGIGETLIDPETKEELERLEILRGKVKTIHVQEKIATLRSCNFEKTAPKREIIKSVSLNPGSLLGMFGTGNTVTETIVPNEQSLLRLASPEIGDVIINP